MTIAIVALMFGILPETLHYWYTNYLSHYLPDIASNVWHPQKIETLEKTTGEVKEFKTVIKMIEKHQEEIVNFFSHGMSNARAERLNGKIKRFVSNNYGVKDKDFILYRIAGYFS